QGVGHWIAERVTSAALVPLVIWGIWAVIGVARGGYGAAVALLASPVNAVLVVLTLAIGFWHMHAGMRVVVEDYVHTPLAKTAVLLLNLFACVLLGALAIFSVLKVAFTAGAV
ncbi:MAG TPA: succinate dehydrogenase, hydrophobic membrane anchor protein, partial [Caulobacteraceae bacterium]